MDVFRTENNCLKFHYDLPAFFIFLTIFRRYIPEMQTGNGLPCPSNSDREYFLKPCF